MESKDDTFASAWGNGRFFGLMRSICELLTFLDFTSNKAYIVEFNCTLSFRNVKSTKQIEGQACGYAIEKKEGLFNSEKTLYALFVHGDSVFFLVGSELYDVASDNWRAVIEKIGICKYEFRLEERGESRCVVTFMEVTQTQPSDPDPSFFVDVVHWLSGEESKANLKKYWSSVRDS